MQNRYHLNSRNGSHFIQVPFDATGLEWLKEIRTNMPHHYKRKRIKSVIQAFPSKTPMWQKVSFN